jgi:hypothetical protein
MSEDDEWEVISSYTNQDALEDGIFVDLSGILPTTAEFKLIVTLNLFATVREDLKRIYEMVQGAVRYMFENADAESQFPIVLESGGLRYWTFVEDDPGIGKVIKLILPEDY